MNGYELSRSFFDFSFENPEKVKPNHVAVYFFAVEHCNRLGWKERFGFPSTMVMEAIGIKSYRTYISCLNDLVEWGFITLIEKSKNQYSSNIIALSKFTKAHDKALDKALSKHGTKQSQSTVQSTGKSIASINKQVTSKPNNNNRAFVADANKDLKAYRLYLWEAIKQKEASREQLFVKCKIDVSKRNQIWEDFITNSIVNVPLIEDDKHVWNTFKKFITDNAQNYKVDGKSSFTGF